jgi:hypothetical protein
MEVKEGWIRYTKLKSIHDPTVGEMAAALDGARKDNTHSVVEQTVEMLKKYSDEVYECLGNGKKHFNSDFYIEVLLKSNESVIRDSISNIFVARGSCPTPFFDQTVYKYTKQDDKLDYLWTVPDIALCRLYANHRDLVPEDEKELYQNICDYYSGALAKREYLENNPDKKIQSFKGVK